MGRIKRAFKRVGNAVQTAAKQVADAPVRAAGSAFKRVSAVAGSALGAGADIVGAARPLAGEVSGLIQDNPALVGAAGAAVGLPFLGGFGGGSAPQPADPPRAFVDDRAGLGRWWPLLAGAGALILIVLLVRRRG